MDRPSEAQVRGHELPRRLAAGTVRALTISDVDAVRYIAAQSFPVVWTEKEFAYFLCHENRLCVGLCSETDGETRLQAYFLGLLVQGDLDIISIATRPEVRRLGLARALLDHVCDQVGVQRAFLEVEVDNGAALHLYEDRGFHRLGLRSAYYGPGRDAILMRWLRQPAV